MKQFYAYLFYKVLDFISTINPKNTIAAWSALCFVAILDFAFLLLVLILFHLYLGFDMYHVLTKFNTFATIALIIVLNYFLLYRNGKYRIITKKYCKENELKKKRGNAIVLIIVVSVFVSLFYFGSILRKEFIKKLENNTEQHQFK